jgi:hypothetical protein
MPTLQMRYDATIHDIALMLGRRYIASHNRTIRPPHMPQKLQIYIDTVIPAIGLRLSRLQPYKNLQIYTPQRRSACDVEPQQCS